MKLPKITARGKSIVLSCIAGIGVVATGLLSAKSALKAEKLETKKEKAIAYIPAVASGCATLVCIGASTYISGEEIAALTVACAATAQKFANYRKAVRENVSEENREKIDETYYQMEIERLEKELAEREHPREDDDLCEFIDGLSPYSFKARYEDVEERLQEVMETWKSDECLAWCQVLYILSGGDTRPYYSPMGCSGGYWSGDFAFGWSRSMFENGFGLENAMERFNIEIEKVPGHEGLYQLKYSIMPEADYLNY